MERGWKNFKEHDRKRLQCLEQSVSKDVNNLLLRTQKEIEGVRRENIHGLREYLNPQEQTVGISQDSRLFFLWCPLMLLSTCKHIFI